MPTTGNYMPANATNVMPGSRSRMAQGSDGGQTVGILAGAGAPTVNVTGLGTAGIGWLYSDTTNGKLYICTATNSTSTIVWTVVGTQV
jgi:hypothetical protein